LSCTYTSSNKLEKFLRLVGRFIWIEFSRQIVEKCSNIKFHENQSSGSWVVPCGQLDGWTDVKKLTVGFGSFAKASKNFMYVVSLNLSWPFSLLLFNKCT